MRSNATAREEEVRRFPDRYIDSVKSPDGRVLRSNREMRDAFRAHFRDSFARCPDLPLQEFRSYLANFPSLGAVEAARCKGVITECEVRDALEPGLDSLLYEVYLRLPHMFVPILTDMFNHWFAQGAIPGSVTKGVIRLLKKGGSHVWEGLDDYRPITLLNTKLKILARVLANRLHLVISHLIGPEQTYAVKGRSIQDNLHLIRKVLEGIEDSTEAALISLDQSKAFIGFWRLFWRLPDSNRSFADGLAWCNTTFRQWCRWTEGVWGRSRSSVRSGRASPCILFSMSSLWSLCPGGLGMRGQIRPCVVSLFAGTLTARVSAFADDITVFVYRRMDIKAVKKVVGEYERIAGAKVNFDKSEGRKPFCWSYGPNRILGVWFGPDLQLERNWPEVQAKVNAQVGTWLSRRLSLKARVGACTVYVFPLILYLPLPCWKTCILGPILDGGRSVETKVRLFLASSQTQRLKVDVSLWAKHRLSASAERPFVTFLGPVTFHGLGRNYIGS